MSAASWSRRLLVIRVAQARVASEKRLLERTRDRDPAAFAEVCRRYGRTVYSLCLSRLQDPVLAEHAAQEALVRFLDVDAPRSASLRQVLFALAEAVCSEPDFCFTHGVPPAATEVAPDPQGLAREERWRRKQERSAAIALGRMRPRYRTSLVLSELHGLSQPEIADAMGMSAEASQNALTAANKAFCRLYAEKLDLPMGCAYAFPFVYARDGKDLGDAQRERLGRHVAACVYCQHEARWADRKRAFAAVLPLLAAIGERVEPPRLAELVIALGPVFSVDPARAVPRTQRFSMRAAGAVALSAVIALPALAVAADFGNASGERPPAAAEQGLSHSAAARSGDESSDSPEPSAAPLLEEEPVELDADDAEVAGGQGDAVHASTSSESHVWSRADGSGSGSRTRRTQTRQEAPDNGDVAEQEPSDEGDPQPWRNGPKQERPKGDDDSGPRPPDEPGDGGGGDPSEPTSGTAD